MDILKRLSEIEDQLSNQLKTVSSTSAVEEIRVAVFGKKGSLTAVLASLKDLDPAMRKEVGQKSNVVKQKLEALLEEKLHFFESQELNSKLSNDPLDASLPGSHFTKGGRHPLSAVLQEAIQILERAGLIAVYGPEVEYEDYCFDKLNFKEGHAARDMQATFFVKPKVDSRRLVLRTHTSPVQVRVLMNAAESGHSLPIRIQVPGRVYRVDDDATHAPMFHQIEGLAVDSTSSMGDLRAVLDYFFRNFFGSDAKIRFRPSYFPFTEPSAEVDVSCVFCKQKGCRICKQSGWLEVAGAGLVHPEVFELCGWGGQKVQGWAFGMGIERLAMLKLGIPDLRLFHENRLSFLRGGLS